MLYVYLSSFYSLLAQTQGNKMVIVKSFPSEWIFFQILQIIYQQNDTSWPCDDADISVLSGQQYSVIRYILRLFYIPLRYFHERLSLFITGPERFEG